VSLPPDGGTLLINYLRENDQTLLGVGDAYLKADQSSHAWIVSTGEPQHLGDPYMSITGAGPVDGHILDLSSSRGELQSQTAMAIITNTFLTANNATDITTTLLGDNKGVQNKCATPKINKLQYHRAPNTDLMMEYKLATNNIQIKSEWVKGHQDENMEWNSIDELKDLKLSNTATLNVWCDRQAETAWIQGWTDPEADVYPSEKWAVFTDSPVSRKITGPLNYNIIYTLSHAALETYIYKKHGICESKLNESNMCGMHSLMKHSKPQK
jgi:hypothetical protein